MKRKTGYYWVLSKDEGSKSDIFINPYGNCVVLKFTSLMIILLRLK